MQSPQLNKIIELLLQARLLVAWDECPERDRRDSMIKENIDQVIAELEGA
jgi:hypothetical protein